MEDQTPTVDEMGAAALATMFGDYDGTVIDSDAGASVGDTPAAPADAQPRGADGKFLPKDSVEEEVPADAEIEPDPEGFTEEVEATEEEETPDSEEEDAAIVLELDEELASLIDNKYGGDLVKALQGLKEAQSLIGRQGSELGELRELRDQIESLQQLMTLQQQASSIDWDEVIAENPEQAVHLAAQYQNPQAFEEAIEAWAASEPIKAFTFLQEIQQAASAPPPTTLEAEVDSLKSRYPDLQQRLPAIEQEAAKRPALQRLLSDQDPRVRAQALEDLYHLSGSRVTPDTSQAARQVILRAKAEADRAKSSAAVVSASNTSPPPAPPSTGDAALAETLQQYVGLGDDFKIVG